MPNVLVKGDKGNHDQPQETILEGSEKTTAGGKPVAYIGAKISDHKQGDDKHIQKKLQQNSSKSRTTVNNKEVAVNGCQGSCMDKFTATNKNTTAGS